MPVVEPPGGNLFSPHLPVSYSNSKSPTSSGSLCTFANDASSDPQIRGLHHSPQFRLREVPSTCLCAFYLAGPKPQRGSFLPLVASMCFVSAQGGRFSGQRLLICSLAARLAPKHRNFSSFGITGLGESLWAGHIEMLELFTGVIGSREHVPLLPSHQFDCLSRFIRFPSCCSTHKPAEDRAASPPIAGYGGKGYVHRSFSSLRPTY